MYKLTWQTLKNCFGNGGPNGVLIPHVLIQPLYQSFSNFAYFNISTFTIFFSTRAPCICQQGAQTLDIRGFHVCNYCTYARAPIQMRLFSCAHAFERQTWNRHLRAEILDCWWRSTTTITTTNHSIIFLNIPNSKMPECIRPVDHAPSYDAQTFLSEWDLTK